MDGEIGIGENDELTHA